MSNRLSGTRIALLATDGVEQVELTEPLEVARNEGAETVPNLGADKIQTLNHLDPADAFEVQGAVLTRTRSRSARLLQPDGGDDGAGSRS